MEIHLEARNLGRERFAQRQAGAKAAKDAEGLGGSGARHELRR
jgi:hypothetical protein